MSKKELHAITLAIHQPAAYETALAMGLSAEHFQEKKLGELWAGLANIKSAAGTVNFENVVMSSSLPPELVTIAVNTAGQPATANIDFFCREMIGTFHQRSETLKLEKLLRGYHDAKNVDDAITARLAIKALLSLDPMAGVENTENKLLTPQEISEDLDHMQEIFLSKKPQQGISTGLRYLDAVIRGWQAPSVYVIGARPGIGKTTLALNFMFNAALNGANPLLISLETNRRQLKTKLYSLAGGLNAGRYFDCTANDTDHERLIVAAQRLTDSRVFLNDTTGSCWEAIAGAISKGVDNHSIDVVFIDYLQLMQSNAVNSKGNRYQELSHITRAIKLCAMEKNVPIVYLAQLSRDLEKSERLPILSDLRDSGTIEQDADCVMFLDGKRDEDERNIIVAKNRFGEANKMVGLTSCMAHSYIGERG